MLGCESRKKKLVRPTIQFCDYYFVFFANKINNKKVEDFHQSPSVNFQYFCTQEREVAESKLD